jgi:Fe-S-cluster containining protein
MLKKTKLYNDGIRFACQGCGKCCVSRGDHGYVYLSFKDRKRLAAHLKMTTTEFTSKYTAKVHGLYELMDTGEGCPLLLGIRCEVYNARPWQCRTWPFWPREHGR